MTPTKGACESQNLICFLIKYGGLFAIYGKISKKLYLIIHNASTNGDVLSGELRCELSLFPLQQAVAKNRGVHFISLLLSRDHPQF